MRQDKTTGHVNKNEQHCLKINQLKLNNGMIL
jgi:hypothetical protein